MLLTQKLRPYNENWNYREACLIETGTIGEAV